MKDAIIKDTGNSRYLRTVENIKQLCPTYDSFLNLLISGEFPVDLSDKNPAGFAELGTSLNKANLLTDATAAIMNLGQDATPNQMFAALANAIGTAVSTAQSAQTAANSANSKITYGTSALTDGVSNLATGAIYIKYE